MLQKSWKSTKYKEWEQRSDGLQSCEPGEKGCEALASARHRSLFDVEPMQRV